LSHAELANIEGQPVSGMNPDIDFIDFLNTQTNDKPSQYSHPPPLGWSEGESLEWMNPDIDFGGLLNTQTNDQTSQYPPLGRSSTHYTTTPTNKTFHMQQALSPVDISIPPEPSSTIRLLDPRPKMKNGQQRIANLILHNLKSYPLMMMHDALPPFIHQRLTTPDAGITHMEPLANCLNLVHMISGGVQTSRKLFWKNVGLECEHLIAEVYPVLLQL